MEVVLDESPEAQSRFQVALPDSQLSAPGTGPQWVLSGRMNERTNEQMEHHYGKSLLMP